MAYRRQKRQVLGVLSVWTMLIATAKLQAHTTPLSRQLENGTIIYKYDPLPDQNHLRPVTIEPDSLDSDVCATIRIVPFVGDAPPIPRSRAWLRTGRGA
ncbi:hypothetical protein GGS23DRAFT_597681 [Durotheca rogersii]|uniref:uncharacterized protein n=1 Tax=Durotheca rogersii TaxID=419775 RepID=UPI00221F5441|nr:uncharacterized protein GGS23DRAFT_597681 [Durotheca rogersii]KAI5862465.1 hypothetical protein GGS23DRAFT_597681 [Durotheca rogersii]